MQKSGRNKIRLALLARELKRKCLLAYQKGERTTQKVKLPQGLVIILSLKKNSRETPYWVLTLRRAKKAPSEREIIICQNAFFPGEEPTRRIEGEKTVFLMVLQAQRLDRNKG